MIIRIKLKEYLQIKRLRRSGLARQAIVLKMPDGKYYKNTRIDILGLKELMDKKKEIEKELAKQVKLF